MSVAGWRRWSCRRGHEGVPRPPARPLTCSRQQMSRFVPVRLAQPCRGGAGKLQARSQGLAVQQASRSTSGALQGAHAGTSLPETALTPQHSASAMSVRSVQLSWASLRDAGPAMRAGGWVGRAPAAARRRGRRATAAATPPAAQLRARGSPLPNCAARGARDAACAASPGDSAMALAPAALADPNARAARMSRSMLLWTLMIAGRREGRSAEGTPDAGRSTCRCHPYGAHQTPKPVAAHRASPPLLHTASQAGNQSAARW